MEGVHAVWQSAKISAASAYDQKVDEKEKEEEREEREKEEGEKEKKGKSKIRKEIMRIYGVSSVFFYSIGSPPDGIIIPQTAREILNFP